MTRDRWFPTDRDAAPVEEAAATSHQQSGEEGRCLRTLFIQFGGWKSLTCGAIATETDRAEDDATAVELRMTGAPLPIRGGAGKLNGALAMEEAVVGVGVGVGAVVGDCCIRVEG